MELALHTGRVVLRRLEEADVGAMMAGLNDYEVARYLTNIPFPYRTTDALEWISKQQAPGHRRAHLAIDLPGEGMIGAIGIEAELGYWLDRRFHGRGIATDSCSAILAWHFSALPDDLVRSSAHVGNHASLHVQRKLGFVETGKTSMRFSHACGREIEHVETRLTHAAYDLARLRLRAN